MDRKTLMLAVALAGVAGLGVGMAILFAGGPAPGPPRPHLPPPPGPTSGDMKYSATLFRALVEQDAAALGVPAPSVEVMAAPFPYFDEAPAKRSLRAGGTLRTPHLRLSLVVRREQGAIEGQSFRADHLVMKIENLTRVHLAYRVTTEVPDATRCDAKGVIAHDAIALAPGQAIHRTECLFQKASTVSVVRVEVVEIPALSYHYVSRLVPGLILYDPRTAAGHTPPKGAACPQTFSWRDVRDGAARGEIAWRDIIDFYARHNCDEYAFFPGYRYRTDPAAPLPVRPQI
ncbi:MAG: hypothetical protein ABUL77_00750 [Bacteroidota bacterium]